MPQLPWELQPIMHKVAVDQVTVFDLPLYHSPLVDEAIYWAELGRQSWSKSNLKGLTNTEQARLFVIRSLRLRNVIEESVSDEDVSKNLTSALVQELFDLLYYGPSGPPEIIPLNEEEPTEKKKPTGENFTGSSSSTTPTPKPSTDKTLVAAQ